MARPSTPVQPQQERAHLTRLRLLDAAVEELLENGYGGLTTPAVAHRAGVSRGAQQNYFPHKTTLVAEAVRHLASRQRDELRSEIDAMPSGQARVRAGLDILFEQYSGPLFAAMLELSLASRGDAELREVVATEEREISEAIIETATALFGDDFSGDREAAYRWATALSAIRGLALLKLLGHPGAAVDRQWAQTRRHLLAMLAGEN